MKIIYILDKPNLYGTEQHVLSLIKNLKNIYEITVITFDDGPLLELLSREKIQYFVVKLGWFPTKKLLNLFDFIRGRDVNIIHGHQPKSLFWGSIVSRILGVPFVSTIHSLPITNVQSHKSYFVKPIIAVSHYTFKFVSELLSTRIIYLSKVSYKKSLFKKKSAIIPNWVARFLDDDAIKFTFCESCINFISVGSVTYNKGFDRMIDALGTIKDQNWKIKILGSGKPEFIKELTDRCEVLGIRDRIEFMGFYDNPVELMSMADGFILLSRGETFGLVYIEAMSCGLPVIAWDIPVVKEILPDGNLIINTVDQIRSVFDTIYLSKQSYKVISSENRRYARENFTLSKILPKYLSLYDQVLSINCD